MACYFSLLPALLALLYHYQLYTFIPFEAVLVLCEQFSHLVIEDLMQSVYLGFIHLHVKAPVSLALGHTEQMLTMLCCSSLANAFTLHH